MASFSASVGFPCLPELPGLDALAASSSGGFPEFPSGLTRQCSEEPLQEHPNAFTREQFNITLYSEPLLRREGVIEALQRAAAPNEIIVPIKLCRNPGIQSERLYGAPNWKKLRIDAHRMQAVFKESLLPFKNDKSKELFTNGMIQASKRIDEMFDDGKFQEDRYHYSMMSQYMTLHNVLRHVADCQRLEQQLHQLPLGPMDVDPARGNLPIVFPRDPSLFMNGDVTPEWLEAVALFPVEVKYGHSLFNHEFANAQPFIKLRLSGATSTPSVKAAATKAMESVGVTSPLGSFNSAFVTKSIAQFRANVPNTNGSHGLEIIAKVCDLYDQLRIRFPDAIADNCTADPAVQLQVHNVARDLQKELATFIQQLGYNVSTPEEFSAFFHFDHPIWSGFTREEKCDYVRIGATAFQISSTMMPSIPNDWLQVFISVVWDFLEQMGVLSEEQRLGYEARLPLAEANGGLTAADILFAVKKFDAIALLWGVTREQVNLHFRYFWDYVKRCGDSEPDDVAVLKGGSVGMK